MPIVGTPILAEKGSFEITTLSQLVIRSVSNYTFPKMA